MAVFLVLSAVFTLARADEPQPAAAQPAAVQPTTEVKPDAETGKPASEAKEAPGAKPVQKASETEGITDAQIKQMRGRGYKPVNRNGTLVFCRSEGQIGTHFERTRCNTIDELKQAELTGKEYVNSIQQQGSPTPFKGP
ncbi:MAG: hypothetical protein QOK23_171 [Gammaproteobacteria bacterium]|jgi:hypothetical protein|nr:hypothetical protein [Gammaproteobacteria bacterium]